MVAWRLRLHDSPGSSHGDGASRIWRRHLHERSLQFAWTLERGGCLAYRTLVCQYGEQDGPTGDVLSTSGSLAHDLRHRGDFCYLIRLFGSQVAIGKGL